MEVDARGRMKKYAKNNLLFSNIKNQPATPGNNIRLTVDRDMQQTAFEALEGKVGSAVAIDVNTGEILSMVSRPSFDPTQFSKGLSKSYWASIVNNKFNPLRDRTIQEHYSPGSTFKTITAIAALEEDIIQPEQIINCGGVFKLGRRPYHDWKINGHGKTNVVKSLRQSVDVYYYKIATMLDIDILADYAKRLGFGSKTGINLPRETLGLIPTKEWKKKQFNEEWQLGETLSCAIGQSYVLATPIQLATAYAAIANGGKLYRPKLVRDIFSNSGQVLQSFKPELVSTVKFSEETMKYIHQGLYEVVNVRKGTAWWSRGRGIRMAGKTGTSQVRSMNKKELFSKCKDMPYESRHHGIFVGFAPFDNPQVAVAVVVEHGCSGSGAAAPVAKEIITTYMKKYHNELYTKYAKEDLISFRKFIKAEKKKKEALEKKKEKEASEEASN
jgi:penicillin-binding protein 2